MPNNIVNLTGYLTIRQAAAGRIAPLVEGHISGYPFRAEAGAAETILDYARRSTLNKPPGVQAHARLISHPQRSFLEVKFISIFDAANPLMDHSGGFEHTSAVLQGHLTVQASGIVCLFTASAALGGQHPLRLGVEEQAALQRMAAASPDRKLCLGALVSGELGLYAERIEVLVKFLSLGSAARQTGDAQPVQYSQIGV